MIKIILYFISILVINFFLKKIKYLPNYSGHSHQVFTNAKNIPLTGGIYILIILFIIFFNNINLLIFSSIMFFIGFTSDKNILVSPAKRLITQILTVTFFVYAFDLLISDSRVDFFNLLLENIYFSYFFSIFCILILINGANFIDGLNGLLLGYFIIVLYIIFKIDLFYQLQLNQNDILFVFISLIFLLILNYLSIFFLGDSGSYLIGIILSYLLISLYNLHQNFISPYFIILLLWYPCFENLFSIIRKNKKGISPINADNKHLHQLLLIYFKNKFNLKNSYINSLVSICINAFNLTILILASLHPDNTKYQIFFIGICILTYLSLYNFLNIKYKLTSKKK
tara:strand:- start:55 stop:1077 length:1023 start_codon:yes stop_codon:yes gene_type:complete